MSAFADWQPRYAEHRIATFPVKDKRPAVHGYMRAGLRASRQFVLKFPDLDAFGFVVGPRNRITVLDIDSPDERVLADALDRHGSTPIIVRSGSGNFQAYYRNSNEGRRIRPDPHWPIDILGGGFVVAPPSQGARGRYKFIQGGLDDLYRLPTLRQVASRPAAVPSSEALRERIGKGQRNTTLWNYCMRRARYCDDQETLLDVARTFNEQDFVEPLDAVEVVKAATSAWSYEEAGENRFGRIDKADDFIGNEDAFFLLKSLRQRNRAVSEIMIANGLADVLGWRVKKLAAARKSLMASGQIELVRGYRQRQPALYKFR